MTGIEAFNFPAFHSAAEFLRSQGHTVICPAESFGGDDSLPRTDYARYDIHALLQVDGVVLLDGWGRSPGACTEVAVAKWLGLRFFALCRNGLTGERMMVEFAPLNPINTHVETAGGPLPPLVPQT
jgi:hypothetical protein